VIWKPEWTLALIPVGGALVITLVLWVPDLVSASTAQWLAIGWFFLSLPFVIGRLIDRAR
jgi:hypothetical protein